MDAKDDISVQHMLIIGGTSGVGRHIALRSLSTYNISVIGRREENLRELEAKNQNVTGYEADVSNRLELETAIKSSVELNGKIDVMVYAAGNQIIKPHRMMKADEFLQSYSVNLGGAMNASSIFCSVKVSRKSATFIAISSISADLVEPGLVAYSVAKAGLNTLIRGLAKEGAPRRFVGIAPGWMDTEMTRRQALYDSNFKEKLQKLSPLGIVTVEEVVDIFDFLVSQKASKITGQIISVDGGYLGTV
jgi:NAD(P)-dependent dehydrogenase (short-subunit alcohol dehydrogenase family)